MDWMEFMALSLRGKLEKRKSNGLGGVSWAICVVRALSPQEAWPGGSSRWPGCARSWDRCCWTMFQSSACAERGQCLGVCGPAGVAPRLAASCHSGKLGTSRHYQLPLIIPCGQATPSLTHDLCLILAPATHIPCWSGPLWWPVGGGTWCSATCVQNSWRGLGFPWWSQLQS